MSKRGTYFYDRAKFWYTNHGLRGLGERSFNFANDLLSPRRRAAGIILKYLFDVSEREALRNDAAGVLEYASESEITIEDPDYGIGPIPSRLKSNAGKHFRDQPAIYEIEDVVLIQPLGVPVYDTNKIVLETFGGRRHKLERYLSETPPTTTNLIRYRLGKCRDFEGKIQCAVSLLNIKYGYFDWVQVALSKLYGVTVYEGRTGTRPTLLIRPDPPDWAIEYLELFGFTDDDWIEWDGQQLQVSTLVVPTSGAGTFEPGSSPSPIYRDDHLKMLNRGVARAVKSKLVGETTETGLESDSGRVYISRQAGTRGRKIVNFPELKAVLDNFGFDVYKFEELEVSEQISIISDADVVVGPHGAGFVNVLFGDDLTVLELLGPEKRKATFYLFSKSLGHDYGFLLCDRDGDGLRVDVSELSATLEEMGIETIR